MQDHNDQKEHQDHDNKEEHFTPIDFEKLAQGSVGAAGSALDFIFRPHSERRWTE
jgi:hypothetical protein